VKGDNFSCFHYNSKEGGGEIEDFLFPDEEKKLRFFDFRKRRVSQNKGEEKFHLHPLKRG